MARTSRAGHKYTCSVPSQLQSLNKWSVNKDYLYIGNIGIPVHT